MQITPQQMQLSLSVMRANEKTAFFPRDDFALEAFAKILS